MRLSRHIEWFIAYARKKRAEETGDQAPLALKLDHTMAVLDNARRIVASEGLDAELGHACLMAALYHDVARFEQYLRFHTFRDGESVNHGRLGVKILKRERRLTGESRATAHLVMTGVGLHNRFSLPPGLPPEALCVVNVVRDADKLDILRVLDEHLKKRPYNPTVILQLPDDQAYSPAVQRCAIAGKAAAYADLKSVNDFRLLLGTWFFDMHFAASRRQFVADGHALNILRGLPDNVIYGRVRKAMLALLARQGKPMEREKGPDFRA